MSEDQEIKIGLTCSDDANNSEIPNSSGWSNGDECVYMNHKVIQKFVGFCPKREGYCYIQAPAFEINFVEVSKLSKPETEAERKERERLEAAYDLYCIYKNAIDMPKISFNSFICAEQKNMNAWLAIVDKTNYRLTK